MTSPPSPHASFPFFPPPFPQQQKHERIDQFIHTFIRPMGEKKGGVQQKGSSVCDCTCHRFCDTLAASRQQLFWPQHAPPPPPSYPRHIPSLPSFPSFPSFSQFPYSSPSLSSPSSCSSFPPQVQKTTKKRKRETEGQREQVESEQGREEEVVSVNNEWAIRFFETAERRKKRKVDREKEYLLRLAEEQKNKKIQETKKAQLLYGSKEGESSIPQSLRQLEGQLNASLDTWSDKHAPVKVWPIDPLNFQ